MTSRLSNAWTKARAKTFKKENRTFERLFGEAVDLATRLECILVRGKSLGSLRRVLRIATFTARFEKFPQPLQLQLVLTKQRVLRVLVDDRLVLDAACPGCVAQSAQRLVRVQVARAHARYHEGASVAAQTVSQQPGQLAVSGLPRFDVA